MKKLCFIFALLLVACSDDDVNEVANEVFNDPNWLKLEIPNGRQAYAVAGSIDDTLLVTTWTKAYYTVDAGATWKEACDFHGPAWGLLERNDTIFSLNGQGLDAKGASVATTAQYFTADHGNTWKFTYVPGLTKPIGTVQSSIGTLYFLQQNLTPISPGSITFIVNPTGVMKEAGTVVTDMSFPYKHNILNLYMDRDDRLYIAASGGVYQEESNSFVCCEPDRPAIVYVSKKSRP